MTVFTAHATTAISLHVPHCAVNMDTFLYHVNAPEGDINWENWVYSGRIVTYWCKLHIRVPVGFRVLATLELLDPTCRMLSGVSLHPSIMIAFKENAEGTDIDLCRYNTPLPKILSPTRDLYLAGGLRFFNLMIRFNSTEEGEDALFLAQTSDVSGYLTSPWYDGINTSPATNRSYYQTLTTPPGYDHVMISFPRFEIQTESLKACEAYVEFFTASLGTVWRKCRTNSAQTRVYNGSSVTVKYESAVEGLLTGFKMLFTFHRFAQRPRLAGDGSGVFNCSVEHYPSFQEHLRCNLERECSDGRDETARCSFSSPECEGRVTSRGKCFFYVKKESVVRGAGSFHPPAVRDKRRARKTAASLREEISRVCKEHGGDRIASIRTEGELLDFLKLFEFGKLRSSPVHIGTSYADPSIKVNTHKQMWTSADNTALFNLSQYMIPNGRKAHRDRPCVGFNIRAPSLYKVSLEMQCEWKPGKRDCVCERDTAERVEKGIDLQPLMTPPQPPNSHRVIRLASLTLVQCPDGHLVHAFLWCDVESYCGGTHLLRSCPFPSKDPTFLFRDKSGEPLNVGMFSCDNADTRLPYTLVCDFQPDCLDMEDETFCLHQQGERSTICENGQSVELGKRCNFFTDCKDGSDEEGCVGYKEYRKLDIINASRVPPPVLIEFDGKGFFWMKPLAANASCPVTHYRCASEPTYCLPVYTRCNGIHDCLDYRDEQGCGDVTCPGFYRCRASSVCVHVQHLCDGWPQCPQRDDELLCAFQCPSGCLCQGYSFLCRQAFPLQRFSQVRYLDVSGSGVSTWYFSDAAVSASETIRNQYLIHLNLSRCSLYSLSDMPFPNLLHLDLTGNELKTVNFSLFLQTKNLRVLYLADNPLNEICKQQTTLINFALRTVDLSGTHLQVFSSAPFERFYGLRFLNLSGTAIHTIDASGFDYVPELRQVDLRGSPLKYFPVDLFQKVTDLRRVDADNYKLCCKEVLPSYFLRCHAPADETSSCADLLRTELFRGVLWLVSVLSVTGNLLCFVFRACLQRTAAKGGFNVFVSTLSLADLLMGLYMTVIGVADAEFRGAYVHHETSWTRSGSCSLAGFLSLVSCEVSTLIVWFITLDRFIVLHFPFSQLRFQRRSATVACLLTWLLGISLALVPLMPAMAHWEFYSQSGICIPLPVTRHEYKGRGYSYGVLIVFNFIMFLLIAGGQAFIYWTIQKNRMKTDSATTAKSRDTTVARRLITVAVTDFFCWFPIGLCGMLASAGYRIPGEVSVAMAIFVLPLNSALNPFLYTFNVVMEKQRKKTDERLLALLEASIKSQTVESDLNNER